MGPWGDTPESRAAAKVREELCQPYRGVWPVFYRQWELACNYIVKEILLSGYYEVLIGILWRKKLKYYFLYNG